MDFIPKPKAALFFLDLLFSKFYNKTETLRTTNYYSKDKMKIFFFDHSVLESNKSTQLYASVRLMKSTELTLPLV